MGKPRKVFEPQRRFRKEKTLRALRKLFSHTLGWLGVGLFLCGVLKWGWIVVGSGLGIILLSLIFTPFDKKVVLTGEYGGTFCQDYRRVMGVRRRVLRR